MIRNSSKWMNFIYVAFVVLSIRESIAQTNLERPNIIFILTDDQRFDALGFSGNKHIYTPEMDKLANEGTYFAKAMVTTPICSASRASILTGLYERTHRYNFQTVNIRESYMINSYPTILKNNGYRTGFFGKYGVRYDGLDKQFDEYEVFDRNGRFSDKRGYYYKKLGKDTVHLTRYTGQKAIDFINKSDNSKPFCLSLSFSAPHAHDNAEDQYFWQEESDTLLANINVPGPKLADAKYFYAQPEFVRNGFNRLRWFWRYDTLQKHQHSVKGYYRMIYGIDREIFKIREELKKMKLDKNTIIILMGDNGYFLGERQLAGKWLLYDNCIRVPLIIYDPRIKANHYSNALATNVDISTTIVDFAGLEPPQSWQGESLRPIVEGKTKNLQRDMVLIEHIWDFENIPPSEGLRTKDWKYFRYVNNKSYEELYNLRKDPMEITNLAKNPKFATTLRDLRIKTEKLINKHSNHYSNGPYNLKVEFMRNTGSSATVVSRAKYTWSIQKNIFSQSAFQILVASSQKKLDNNIGDVWNSGEIRSKICSKIEHIGNELIKGRTYFWKVRIWDENNRLSDYSESQAFIMKGH